MGRARLDPVERDRRAAERSRRTWSGENYRTYDPTNDGGFGRKADWERIAAEMFGGKVLTGPPTRGLWLFLLGLDTMPTTRTALKKAFHTMMFKVHPDMGGTAEATREVMEAYEMLKMRYETS